jgi:hypothetical protein
LLTAVPAGRPWSDIFRVSEPNPNAENRLSGFF